MSVRTLLVLQAWLVCFACMGGAAWVRIERMIPTWGLHTATLQDPDAPPVAHAMLCMLLVKFKRQIVVLNVLAWLAEGFAVLYNVQMPSDRLGWYLRGFATALFLGIGVIFYHNIRVAQRDARCPRRTFIEDQRKASKAAIER